MREGNKERKGEEEKEGEREGRGREEAVWEGERRGWGGDNYLTFKISKTLTCSWMWKALCIWYGHCI